MIADNPDQRIDLKIFHAKIINNYEVLKKEAAGYKALPLVRDVTSLAVKLNYLQVKQEAEDIINSVLEMMMSDPETTSKIIKK